MEGGSSPAGAVGIERNRGRWGSLRSAHSKMMDRDAWAAGSRTISASRDRAIVLYELYRGARRVTACSARAAGLGIARGMSLSEASALGEASTTTLHLEAADPTADRQGLEALARACQQFSPVVGLEEADTPECLLLDITGLDHLFHGERLLAEEVFCSMARRGLAARIGVADTVGAAWAAAHFEWPGHGTSRKRMSISILASQQALSFLRAMPVQALRLPDETVEVLRQLGIYRIDQLAALPRAELAARFGPQLLRRWDQVLGEAAEPILGQPFPEELQAEQLLEQPTTRRETIEFLLHQLIGRVAEMLFHAGRGATQLECRLDCGAAEVDLSVGLFQPTDLPQHLWQLVQMRLERVSLPAPVAAVSVRAATTAVLQRRQRELFGDRYGASLGCEGMWPSREHAGLIGTFPSRGRLGYIGDAERLRFLAALIDRLSSRLGRRAVLRARLVADAQPELACHYDPLVEKQSGQRARRAGSGTGVMLKHNLRGCVDGGERPLCLMGRPVSLAATSILPEGPPLRFQWQGRECRIAHCWGPERIQTGWWRGQPIGRDYYRIETAAGRRYWVFRRLRDGRWFMHGMFE